jgi:hypothetical protein
MAHINSITAVRFASLAYSTNVADFDTDEASKPAVAKTAFDSGVSLVGDLREFPSLGTPANIVNVPVYGQAQSQQVGGQSDAPTLEFTLNYNPSEHYALDTLRKNATQLTWRVRLSDVDGVQTATGLPDDSDNQYNDIYFVGKIESLEVTPSLSDSMQATFSVSCQSDFEGPYSENASAVYGLPA